MIENNTDVSGNPAVLRNNNTNKHLITTEPLAWAGDIKVRRRLAISELRDAFETTLIRKYVRIKGKEFNT